MEKKINKKLKAMETALVNLTKKKKKSLRPLRRPTQPLSDKEIKEKIESINIHRIASGDNPKEERFLKEWNKINKDDNILRYILEKDPNKKNEGRAIITNRDREVAITLIQWLGTLVGQNFIKSVSEEE